MKNGVIGSSGTWVVGGFVGTAMLAGIGLAQPLVTLDPVQAAAFQAGGVVLGFDALPPNGGGGAQGATGVVIQPPSRLTNQLASQGVVFSSAAGPVGVVSVQGLPNQGDARSPFNIIGGSSLNAQSLPALDYLQYIELRFVDPRQSGRPGTTDRVGAWNDPSGSQIRLSVFGADGALLGSTLANQAYFVGYRAVGIARARFEWVANQSAAGFSLDDVSFGPVAPRCPCLSDVDDGTGTGACDGGVTIDDLLYYLSIFEQGTIAADIDDGSGTGTPDGGVTIDDLLYFLQRLEEGC